MLITRRFINLLAKTKIINKIKKGVINKAILEATTVRSSAKARLTWIRIRIWICIWIRDPDRQNLIVCSLAHC